MYSYPAVNTPPVSALPLKAADSLSIRAFHERAQAGERLCVVFLGGSLTWGAQATDPQKTSYRAIIGRRLEEAYSRAHFRLEDAAIGGTGSQLGAFRLERDVMAHRPDLVFLDFTVNDAPCEEPDPHKLAAYESIVRRLILAGVPVVQVRLSTKKDTQPHPPVRLLDPRHAEIAAAYVLPAADAVALARQRVASGQTTPDLLWDLPEDQTHPGDAGYAVYADAVWAAFTDAVENRITCALPPQMLHADTYMTLNRFRLANMMGLPAGWRKGRPHRNASAYDFVCSRWMEHLAIASGDAHPAPLRLIVRGSDILLFGEQTRHSGSFAVSIDGGEPLLCNARCAESNMRLHQPIITGLDPAIGHLLEITPRLAPGEELRLESVCVAGAPATVQVA